MTAPDPKPADTHCYVAIDRRGVLRRFVDRLFPYNHLDAPDDLEGYAPSYMVTDTYSYLDWKDRLRVLVSGKLRLKTQTKTDVIVTKMVSTSALTVLPPYYHMERGE